jgi:putative Mn2+ efflux pump MntP
MIVAPIVDFLNFLADNLGWFWVEYIQEFIGVLPRFVIAVLIILLGVKLIRGKKKELDIDDSPVDVIADQIQQTADNLTANGGE